MISSVDEKGRAHETRDFFLCLFLVVLLGLGSIILINVVIDPRGTFGTGYFKPLVITSRTEKLNLLDNFSASPQIIVFGASNAGRISPVLISNLTNKTAFNAGVSAGATEDFYALLAYLVEDRHFILQTVIVDLDLFSFSDYTGFSEELVSEPRLYAKVGGGSNLVTFKGISRFTSTIRPSYITDDLTVLNYTVFGYPPVQTHYDSLGYMHYDILDEQKRDNTFNLTSASNIAATQSDCSTRYATMNGLSEQRKHYFELFLGLANRNNITAVIFSPPYSPECMDILNNQSNYLSLVKEEHDYLMQLKTRYNFTYLDYSDLSAYGGYPDGFYDGFHTDSSNSDLITELLLKNETGAR